MEARELNILKMLCVCFDKGRRVKITRKNVKLYFSSYDIYGRIKI